MIKEEKKSKDVYFVAALLALGADISTIDRTDPKHIEFTVIRNYDDLLVPINRWNFPMNDFEIGWANGDLMVNAVKYKDALQRLKGIIHSR